MDLSNPWTAMAAITGAGMLVTGWVYRIWDSDKKREAERVADRNQLTNALQTVQNKCTEAVQALDQKVQDKYVPMAWITRFDSTVERSFDEVKQLIKDLDQKFDRKFDRMRLRDDERE